MRSMDGEDADANVIDTQLGAVIVGGDKTKRMRSIMNFDVSAVASRTISAAELLRHKTGIADQANPWSADIKRCTRPTTWTEAGITWNKYDGTNNWTTAGGDVANPTVMYTEPATDIKSPITGMVGFVTDAISLRSNIVSVIHIPDNENPPDSDWLSINDDQISMFFRPQLAITHDGRYIGARLKRGAVRGHARGVRRGVV